MSRRYDMCITVDHFKSVADLVKTEGVISDCWTVDYSNQIRTDVSTLSLEAGGENYLCGGESEEEFAARVSEAVWEELGYFVEVTVRATYLEEIPFETHICSEDEYDYWLDGLRDTT